MTHLFVMNFLIGETGDGTSRQAIIISMNDILSELSANIRIHKYHPDTN